MSYQTIRLVDVERGDKIHVIGHLWIGTVIRLDRIADKVSIVSDDGRFGTFDAKDVIGHWREGEKPGTYQTLWTGVNK